MTTQRQLMSLLSQLIPTSASSETSLQALAALSAPESPEEDAPSPKSEDFPSPASPVLEIPNLSTPEFPYPATPETSLDFLDNVNLATPEPLKDILDDSGFISSTQPRPVETAQSLPSEPNPDVTDTITDVLTGYTLARVDRSPKTAAPQVKQATSPVQARTCQVQQDATQLPVVHASNPVRVETQQVTVNTPQRSKPIEDTAESPSTTVMDRLSQDPAFQDLHRTLMSTCMNELNPITLLQCQNASPIELPIRESALAMQFQLIKDRAGEVASTLHNFYECQKSQFDSKRFHEICMSPMHEVIINAYYDNLQHELINRVTKCVNLLETSITPRKCLLKRKSDSPANTNSLKKHRSTFSEKALTVLNEWYNLNAYNPYPTAETVEVLSQVAEIQPDQVKKWISNKRARTNNTVKKDRRGHSYRH